MFVCKDAFLRTNDFFVTCNVIESLRFLCFFMINWAFETSSAGRVLAFSSYTEIILEIKFKFNWYLELSNF